MLSICPGVVIPRSQCGWVSLELKLGFLDVLTPQQESLEPWVPKCSVDQNLKCTFPEKQGDTHTPTVRQE